uniref:Uncharacterized protein n=1 Tax=Strix occidentalis caurina TaxID=311401 RepID=A0A8D0EYJ0_STROC
MSGNSLISALSRLHRNVRSQRLPPQPRTDHFSCRSGASLPLAPTCTSLRADMKALNARGPVPRAARRRGQLSGARCPCRQSKTRRRHGRSEQRNLFKTSHGTTVGILQYSGFFLDV